MSGSIKHNDIDTAPRQLGSARFVYNDGELQAELEWIHMGEYYLEPENQEEYSGHDLFNLRLAKQFNPVFSGALRITNLFDQNYAERADFGFGGYRYFVGESRAIFTEIKLTSGKE